jgi:hypothetical protein
MQRSTARGLPGCCSPGYVPSGYGWGEQTSETETRYRSEPAPKNAHAKRPAVRLAPPDLLGKSRGLLGCTSKIPQGGAVLGK